jgi:cytochrome P450
MHSAPPLFSPEFQRDPYPTYRHDLEACAKLIRDRRQYADSDRLDVRRPRDAHVCLGATLARLEGRLSMAAVMRRFPNLELIDEQPDWGPNFAFRGLNTLRVRT